MDPSGVATGFIVGAAADLVGLSHAARRLDPIDIAALDRPGWAITIVTNPQAELLACTELYLSETYSSHLRVLCSD